MVVYACYAKLSATSLYLTNHAIDLISCVCSGSLISDSPLSGRLPLEGDCLDEETMFIFSGVQTGSKRV